MKTLTKNEISVMTVTQLKEIIAEACIELNNKEINDIQKMQNENDYCRCKREADRISEAAIEAGYGYYNVGYVGAHTYNIRAINFDGHTCTGYQRSGGIRMGDMTGVSKDFKPSLKYINQVLEILRKFDLSKMPLIVLVYNIDTKTMTVMDGLHRLICCYILGIPLIPATIYDGLDEYEQSLMYSEQDLKHHRLTDEEVFAAKTSSDSNSYQAKVNEVCKKKGIKIMKTAQEKDTLSNFRIAPLIVEEHGEEGLEFVIDFLREVFPTSDNRINVSFLKLAERVCTYKYKEKEVNDFKVFIKTFNSATEFAEYCVEWANKNGANKLGDKLAKTAMLKYADYVLCVGV